MHERVLHLHVVEDTPSTVWVSGAQTFPTSGVLVAALHWNSHHLETGREREQGGDAEIINTLVVIKLAKRAVYSAGWR